MAGAERHMFPGNNTPEGFFSYYQYILGPREADKVIYIKGGPRAGKSAFMKRIGESLLQNGLNIDFLHCASDNSFLEGIVLRDKKIVVIDGTSPNIANSVNQASIDSIIHLGGYWDEEGIQNNRDAIVSANDRIKGLLRNGYRYLAAAGKMYDNLCDIYESAIRYEELYRISAKIIGDEMAHREISANEGEIRKCFASAVTPGGFTHYIDTLAEGCSKIYLIHAPVGVSSEGMLNLFMEGAVYRGFRVEGYYCPMKPSEKLEHLIIPELSLAFLTSNPYHIVGQTARKAEVVPVELRNIIRHNFIRCQEDILADSRKKMDELLERSVCCFRMAKEEQDELEKYYAPTMDLLKIDALRKEMVLSFSK